MTQKSRYEELSISQNSLHEKAFKKIFRQIFARDH